MKLAYATLLTLCTLAAAVHAAEEAPPAVAAAVELFNGPEGIDLQPAPYPSSERMNGGEGWVIVNMMISPGGDRGCYMQLVGQPGATFRLVQL